MRHSSRAGTRARVLLAATAALHAALLAGCAGSGGERAGAAHYTDALGDGGSAPDVRAVDVTSTPEGRISFRVMLAPLRSDVPQGIDLWLDTDADGETGNTTFDDAGGAEYLLSSFLGSSRLDARCGRIGAGKDCLARWTENGWSTASAPTAHVARTDTGLTIVIDRRDLGDTDELNFYAVGWADGRTVRKHNPAANQRNRTT
jgi:hypothetical protein